jgi:hypothetical protein
MAKTGDCYLAVDTLTSCPEVGESDTEGHEHRVSLS